MGAKKPRLKILEPTEEKPKKEEKKRPVARPVAPKLVIRVAGTDLDGEKPVARALRKIKGISYSMSKAICHAAKINPLTKLGSLTEAQIDTLENIIKNPVNFNVPSFLVNRRRDFATGADLHLTSSDLDIARKFDIQRYVDLRTYRGWRHMLGQPVRGQRTRSTFREKGRVVGVMKKAIKLQLAAARKEEAKAEKK